MKKKKKKNIKLFSKIIYNCRFEMKFICHKKEANRNVHVVEPYSVNKR